MIMVDENRKLHVFHFLHPFVIIGNRHGQTGAAQRVDGGQPWQDITIF
jgi:hypothetical protein